jgi:hypothetical protein
MLALESKDVPPTLIARTGGDVRVRDGPSSIPRTPSGNVHRLRVKSRDEKEPSMSHQGLSTSPPGSSGSTSGVSPPLTVGMKPRSRLDAYSPGRLNGVSPRTGLRLKVGDMSLLPPLATSTPGSTSRLKQGSISTLQSSLPASLGSREPPSRHIQPGTTRGVRRYHSTSSANVGGVDTPRSRRLGVKSPKNVDGIMKPIEKSKSGLASLFGEKKSKSKKEKAPSLGAGLYANEK